MRFRRKVANIFNSMKPSGKDRKLTEGSIGTPLLYLALPLVITNLLQTAYNLADTIWVGKYSTDGLAAITFAFPMVFLLVSLGLGISIAGSVLVAQRSGADNYHDVQRAASQTLTYAIIFGILMGAVSYLFVGDIIRLLGASASVAVLATNYMQIISLGLVFLFGFTVFNALSRGSGDTVTPMIVMFGSVALNILLDPILIFGFQNNPLFAMLNAEALQQQLFTLTGYTGDGLKGAAIATIFSRSLAFIVGLYLMINTERSVRVRLSKMKPDLRELKNIVKLGAPATAESLGRSLSVNLMLLIVGLFPTAIVAGYGIGIRVFSVMFLPAIAVSQGVETITGQNYGAEKPERIIKTNSISAGALFLSLTALGIVVWFTARPIVSIFTDNPAVINAGVEFLHFLAPTFGFTGIVKSYAGGFRGIGKTTLAAVINIVTLAIIRLPTAYFTSTIIGPDGIWIAFAVSNGIGAVVAYTLFKRIEEKLR